MKLEGADFDAVLAMPSATVMRNSADLDIDAMMPRTNRHSGSLAHGFWVQTKQVHVEGIRHIPP